MEKTKNLRHRKIKLDRSDKSSDPEITDGNRETKKERKP